MRGRPNPHQPLLNALTTNPIKYPIALIDVGPQTTAA
jgi:hypothetical protein